MLQEYDFYWRVEPGKPSDFHRDNASKTQSKIIITGIELKCDVDVDPFLFMEANNKVYGFTIALYEYERTIQTL